jgi:futalosine hydrolase
MRAARGCTVNTCTGTEETGRRRESLTGAGFESMEGAAAALAGAELGIPVCELRAISNIASTRDFRPENAKKALIALGEEMGRLFERFA